MKFECESCHAQYMIADEKVGKRGVKVKCKKCQHIIIVRPDAGGAGAKAESADKGSSPKAPSAAKATAEPAAQRTSTKNADGAGARSSERKKNAPEKAAVELATVAGAPPPGLDLMAGPADDGAGSFAPAAAPDPSAQSTKRGGADEPAPSPLASSDEASAGSLQERAAPAAEIGDQTQITANPSTGVAVDGPKKPDDRTELGAPFGGKADAPVAAAATKRADKSKGAPGAQKPTAPSSDDALGDQLNGAFNAMFVPATGTDPSGPDPSGPDPSGDDERGPTRVLDQEAVDALRKSSVGGAAVVAKAAAGADDGPPDQVWHVAIDDQDVGPLSLAEVGRHIEGGRVQRDSLVWKTGMGDWLPAGNVPAVRALFNKVPAARTARADDAARNNKRPSAGAGDIAVPGIALEASAPPAKGVGASPFDESDDPSWHPHGLTDVYQAANLAETAGAGIGGMGMGPAIGGGAGGDPEWRPAAASALASLVNDEISRLEERPPVSDMLSPGDDASFGAPPFADLRGGVDLAGPEVSGLLGRGPSHPPMNASFDAGPLPPAFPPSQGFMPPPQAGLSPFVLGGGAILVVAVIVLVAVVAVVALKGGDHGPKIVDVGGKLFVVGPDGSSTPLNGEDNAKPAIEVAPTIVKPIEGAVAIVPPLPAVVPVLAAAVDPAAPPAALDGTRLDGATASATAPDKERRGRSRSRDPAPRRDDPTPSRPGSDAPRREGACDPVLDFDCKAGTPSASSASAKEAPKEVLSKADVLVVVKANMGSVESCGRKNNVAGVIKMSWKIEPNGKTSEVAVADSKFAGTPVGNCVTGEIKGWRFPASKTSTPVSFPIKLGG
jgi:predicted Zn finger-like uncharacterized protein